VGSTTGDISPQLALFGSIAGTVSGPAGAPLAGGTNGEVSVFNSARKLVSVQRFSSDGTYQVGQLIAGDYRMQFKAYDKNGNPGYQSSWWQNATSAAAGTVVQVTGGGTTGNINPQLAAMTASVAAALPPGQSIPGRLPAAVNASSKKAIRLPVRTGAGQLIRWTSATPRVCKVGSGKLRVSGKRAMCRLTASATLGGRLALIRKYRIRVN
jgi:hypothetical protein